LREGQKVKVGGKEGVVQDQRRRSSEEGFQLRAEERGEKTRGLPHRIEGTGHLLKEKNEKGP